MYKISRLQTISFSGVDILLTNVECSLIPGIPSFSVVGLGDKTISESKERVKSAIINSGFSFPNCKIIINLSPADIFKEGSHYDLPIALAIIAAMGEIIIPNKTIIMGELCLNGEILPPKGVLATVIFAHQHKYQLIVSAKNSNEIILPIHICVSDHLKDLIASLKNKNFHQNTNSYKTLENTCVEENIFDQIYGQSLAKRALLIAAAGRHNIILMGSKGVGKSMLSKSLLNLCPSLTETESLHSTSIYSVAGELKNSKIIQRPVFRSPHSSSSLVSLIGGGSTPKPGEISLSHHGILFFDELQEFSPSVIDALKTPLEERQIWVSRSKYKIVYPCDFQLIIAMNPCKCGELLNNSCFCGKKNYLKKISGPIWDRIELKVSVQQSLFEETSFISLEEAKKKIVIARQKQNKRFDNYNSRVSLGILEKTGEFSDGIVSKAKEVCMQKALSGRFFFKLLSVARTIADLENSKKVLHKHFQEALFFVDCSNIMHLITA